MRSLPQPDVDGYQPFPTLRRFRTPDYGYDYVVGDPAALRRGDRLSRDGSVEAPDAYFSISVCVAIGFYGIAALLESKGAEMPPVYWVLASLAALFCLGMSTMLKVQGLRAKKRAELNTWTVSSYWARAYDLCSVADRIASTGAWRYGHVDPERHIPGLLYRYVDAAIRLQMLMDDIKKAKAHPNLAGLVEVKEQQAGDSIMVLEDTRQQFLQILQFAGGLDQHQRDLQAQKAMQREEDQLRWRLGGSSLPVMRQQDDAWTTEWVAERARFYSQSLVELDRRIAAVVVERI